MSNLVIVAIPDENDRVWKVSSEKVPHLTLLFLGDSDQVGNLEKIVEFTEHAANTSLRRFYLPVDRRGELGNDPDLGPADVLFFKKGRYDYKAIRDFRAALLQDHNIRKAYDAATQHEGPWMPHLTLGYEKRPANPDPTDRDYGFYDVAFTKIAVWIDDFDGPEFLLKDYWDEWDALETVPMDVAMSALRHAETVSDAKWSNFKNSDYTTEQWARACLLDRGVDVEGKARYGLPVREPDGTLNRNACHAAAAVLSSTGGTGTARGNTLKGPDEAIAKAKKRLVALYKGPLSEDVPEGLGEKKSEMQQTIDLGAAFLAHYGVKGMRWGVRKEDLATGAKAVGSAAKTAGGGVGKAAGAVSRFVGDANFEARVENGKAREAVINKAQMPFLKEDLPAVKARHGDYGKLKNRAKKPFSKEARAYRKDARETYIKRLETTANSMKNASGDREYTIRERGIDQPAEGGALPKSKQYWDVTARNVKHAFEDDFTRLEVVMDDEGYITDLKQVEIENSMAQSFDLGEFLAHYGVKGMRWGVRNDKGGSNTSGVGETKREGIQKFLDPQGHELGRDITKVAVGTLVPIVAPLTWPAQVRLTRGAFRGAKAKALDSQEKKFAKNAMSPKNFAAIHNGSLAKANPAVSEINKKYPNPNKNPSTRKKYDAEVLKVMQDAYRESANSLVNKANTMHLDVEFHNNGDEFKIHARQGPGTPIPHARHAAEDDLADAEITVEITGKIKRDAMGHIVGFEFDDFSTDSAAVHSVDLGAALVSAILNGETVNLEHYGVKGMRWGVRKERAVTPTTHTDTGILRRRTQVRTKGGHSAPAHHDAVKAAVAKQLVKKSGTDALSTQELRDLANRLQVENQVKVLMSSKGKTFVKGQLESEGKQALVRGAKGAAPHVSKRVKKAAAGAATVAALL